ncbi:hypothetical protein ScPMuIL_008148 [Solemya velum]
MEELLREIDLAALLPNFQANKFDVNLCRSWIFIVKVCYRYFSESTEETFFKLHMYQYRQCKCNINGITRLQTRLSFTP